MTTDSTRDIFAHALASADGYEQGRFFNAFVREMNAMCRANGHRGEEQVMYMVRYFDGPAREAVDHMAAFVKYERDPTGRRPRYASKCRHESLRRL